MVRSFDWLPSQVSLSNPGLMESNKSHDRNRLSTLLAISSQMQVTKAFCACSRWCFCMFLQYDYCQLLLK